mgnify:CR=1 FL=1
MEFNRELMTKKEQKTYDALDSASKAIYEKQWCKIKEEQNKLNATIARAKEKERKQRTHRLIQVGGAIESAFGGVIEGEEELKKLIAWAKKNNIADFKKML